MQLSHSFFDLRQSFKATHLWLTLGWYDIKQRYRRSILGPFWLTLSTGVSVGTLSFLWSKLFKTNLHEYLPFFAIGSVIWAYISGQINEACTGFTQFTHIMKQVNLPLPSYLLRLLVRNFIILLHNFVIVFIVITFVGSGWQPVAILALPGLLLLSIALFFMSLTIAIICTRYRDMPPIVQNIITILFYFTPILWQSKYLPPQYAWVKNYNPFTHLIEIVRAPLLGSPPSALSWGAACGVTLIAAYIAITMLARYRQKVAYWL